MKTLEKLIPLRVAGILLLSLFTGTSVFSQVTDSARATGAEIKTFYSKVLGENRKITIQTPARMNPLDTYPVLYVLDGESQAEMVGAQVKYLSESYRIIPELIVVGIENTDRTRDLTPTHSIIGGDGKPDTSSNAFGRNSGGGEKFLEFMKTELVPYMETHYPVSSFRILGGHSLGGLMAVYCLMHHADYFNAYIAISPSLQWDNKIILKQARTLNKTFANRMLFFCDANEDAAFHQNQVELDSLIGTIHPAGLKYKQMFYPGETHISEPVKAYYDGIRFVYPNWHLPYNSAAFRRTMTAAAIIGHYKELSEYYGYNVVPLHDELNQIARFFRNDPKRIGDAIEILEFNARNHPSSATVQELLGDTWTKAGDTKKALASYRKSLELQPGNTVVQKKISELSH